MTHNGSWLGILADFGAQKVNAVLKPIWKDELEFSKSPMPDAKPVLCVVLIFQYQCI